MPSAVLKTPTPKFLFMLEVKGVGWGDNSDHWLSLGMTKRIRKKCAVCGIQASIMTCREAVCTIPCRNQKYLQPACYESQYIESRGAMGKPGSIWRWKPPLTQYCSNTRWKGTVLLLRQAVTFKQRGKDWLSSKGRSSLNLTPLSLLPASQHFSSCPLIAARGLNLISWLNIVITSDYYVNLIHLVIKASRE